VPAAPQAAHPKEQGSPKFTLKNPRAAWISVFNLGAFVAGISAGYFFRKMEEEFTRWGENVFAKVFRGRREHGPDEDRESRFSHHDQRRDERPHGDPMGTGRRYAVEDEEERI
jgi:hypothetical protein